MNAGAPAEATHARLAGVTRVFPAAGGQPPVHALGPVDLGLRRGEFFAVVGPSGCGKSTLAGNSRRSPAADRRERGLRGASRSRGEVPDGIGVVFQEDASFPWLTVWDNTAFGLRRNAVPETETRRRVDDALAFMGLKDFARAYPSQLSGGMRQRVCIARTLVLQPRLILLDEPFGALDAQTRLLMGDEVLRLWRSTGATVLLITHALDEAAMLSDRIGAMSARPGRFMEIVETGWPRDRDSKIVSEARFGEITARLWENLRGESIKALGHAGMAAGMTRIGWIRLAVIVGAVGTLELCLPGRPDQLPRRHSAVRDGGGAVQHPAIRLDERRYPAHLRQRPRRGLDRGRRSVSCSACSSMRCRVCAGRSIRFSPPTTRCRSSSSIRCWWRSSAYRCCRSS